MNSLSLLTTVTIQFFGGKPFPATTVHKGSNTAFTPSRVYGYIPTAQKEGCKRPHRGRHGVLRFGIAEFNSDGWLLAENDPAKSAG